MCSQFLRNMLWVFVAVNCVSAQQPNSCAGLMSFKTPNLEITKSAAIAAGTTEPNPWGPGHSAPLPAYCRVEGVINRRTGVGGEDFGITFVLAMPEKMEWRFPDARRSWKQWRRDAATWSECCWRYTWIDAWIRRGQYGHRPQESSPRL